MTTPGGPLGRAISDVVAETVHKVIVSVLPHHHVQRMKATTDAINAANSRAHEMMAPMAQHVLDNCDVHPVLRPLFDMLAGRD